MRKKVQDITIGLAARNCEWTCGTLRRQAAKNLEFELAAILMDEVSGLKKV